jgi:hypothetical protein
MHKWFSLLCPTPGEHGFNKLGYLQHVRKLHVNLSFPGPVVLEKIFKWPHLFFYDYLPLKEVLAISFNKL